MNKSSWKKGSLRYFTADLHLPNFQTSPLSSLFNATHQLQCQDQYEVKGEGERGGGGEESHFCEICYRRCHFPCLKQNLHFLLSIQDSPYF